MIEQDTEEWHLWRSKGIGSSDIGSIMGLNKYKSLRKLWLEKTGQSEDSFEDNEYTRYGKHKEKYALAEYEWQFGVSGEPKLFVHSKYDFARASFDSFINAKPPYGIEVKSPYNPKNILPASQGKIDKKYYAQLQWLMFVSGTSMIKYVVFNGAHKIYVKDVLEDRGYQRRMIRYASWFWCLVKNKVDPKRRKPKHIYINDKDVE